MKGRLVRFEMLAPQTRGASARSAVPPPTPSRVVRGDVARSRCRLCVADVVFASLMAAVAAVYVLEAVSPGEPPVLIDWVYVVASVGFAVCALWWRVYVRTVGVVVGVLLLVWGASFWAALPINTGVPPALVFAPLVIYAWTRWLPYRRDGLVALGVAAVGAWISPAMWAVGRGGLEYQPSRVVAHWAIIGCAYLLASRRRGIDEARACEMQALEARNEALLADRTRQQALAVQRERALIAREIHDVLAHSLTLIQVQSTAGLVAARSDPRAAGEALRTVRGVTSQALAEVREIVAVLRGEDGGNVSPGGDLRDIPAELERFRQAGLSLVATLPEEEQLETAQREISLVVRLGARRILGESLTNVMRHGGPHPRAEIEFTLTGDLVRIVVSNDVADGPDRPSPGGYGLRGLSERAAGLGGWCHAERVGGAFRVCAEIPTAPGDILIEDIGEKS